MDERRLYTQLCADSTGASIRRLVKWWFPELRAMMPGPEASVEALADALVDGAAKRGQLEQLERALAIERTLRVVLPPLAVTAGLVVVQAGKARGVVDGGWRLGFDAATVLVVLAQVGRMVQAAQVRGRGAVRAGLSAIAFVLVVCLGMSLVQRWTPARPDVLYREHRGLADCWRGAFVETNYNKLGLQSVWADVAGAWVTTAADIGTDDVGSMAVTRDSVSSMLRGGAAALGDASDGACIDIRPRPRPTHP